MKCASRWRACIVTIRMTRKPAPIWDTVQEAQAFKTMTDGMKFFLGAVGIVTLLLGGIGVMNVMLVAVRERTREIGVRKAIGAPAGTILRQFFIEALIIALLSGGDRAGRGVRILCPGQPAAHARLFCRAGSELEFRLIAAGLLGAIAVGAALYPARSAASIDPIEALRYEAGG